MTIQELRAKAGSPAGYAGYFLLLFIWFALENAAISLGDALPDSPLKTLLDWGFRLLVVPALLAGIYGGIDRRQQDQQSSGLVAFFGAVRQYYWRMLAAQLLYYLMVFVLLGIVLTVGGKSLVAGDGARVIAVLINAPIAAMNLFWFAGLVVENQIFRGLWRGLKTLLFNSYGLLIGIGWAILASADTFFFNVPGPATPGILLLDGLRALVLAGARLVAISLGLALYKQLRGQAAETFSQELSAVPQTATPSEEPAGPSPTAGNGWVRTSFVFAFLAFIPLLNFVALGLGLIALRVKKRFVFRAVIACGMGVFFTLFYLLAVAGLIVGRVSQASMPGYSFLAQSNPALQAQVALLQKGSYQKVEQQLAQSPASSTAADWTTVCLSALAKYGNGDVSGSLLDFQTAAKLQPARSEFYLYYGVALLEKGNTDQAAIQFQAAQTHAPKLAAAQQYLDLIHSPYQPPILLSTLLSILVLLILFTLHELGHAYMAWRLGDDTAKNLGRLTFNPLKHLDPVGSILLPGIMLIQQTGIVFGWAKPVPINRANFKNPQQDQMRVSFAGPAVNLVIAMVCFIFLGVLMICLRLAWPGMLTLNVAKPYAAVYMVGSPLAGWLAYPVVFIKQMLYTSLILGIFNLIPIPPLDGSWILSGLLPERISLLFEKTRKFGFLIFLLLVVTPAVDSILAFPLGIAWGLLQVLASSMHFG